MPTFTLTGCGTPSLSSQIWRVCPAPGPAPPAGLRLAFALRGGPGISCETMPRLALAGLPAASAPAWAGVKRKAVLGTSSTSLRSVEVMVAAAVMPGRRLRSLLSTSSQVI